MPFTVVVNVYDLTNRNKYIYPFGLGIFHTGVEINGVEYAFGGHEYEFTGIFKTNPRDGLIGVSFRECLEMGRTELSQLEIDQLMIEMGQRYTGSSYNLLTRNCNHFTEALIQALCAQSIPRWINRMAALGTWVPCFIDTSGGQFGTGAPDPAGVTQASRRNDPPFDLRNVPRQCQCQHQHHQPPQHIDDTPK